jgi:FkbM family methyltransferase
MLEILHEVGSKVRHSAVLERQTWLWRRVEPAWQGMFRQASENKGFATHINSDLFRLTYEWGSRYDRADQRVYEPVFYGAMTEIVREGMTVFDIGAHIGIFSLGVAKRIGPIGKVYAFEPCPETAGILERHVIFNQWQDRVSVVRAVTSDLNETVSFYVNGISMSASMGRENVEVLSADRPADGAHRIDVESVTLDRFCAERNVRPDLFKIDVEGAELRVLRGAKTLLLTARPSILCEVHPKQNGILRHVA